MTEREQEKEFLYDRTVAQYNRLKKQYLEVLSLAKTSADTYEYCLSDLERKVQELTEENRILKERIKKEECKNGTNQTRERSA